MKMAKLGLLFDRNEAEKRWSSNQNVFEMFLFEVLNHLRIPYEVLDAEDSFDNNDVLISVLTGDRHELGDKLIDYVGSGGTLISYGGLDCIKGILGLTSEKIDSKGYAFISDILSKKMPPLRFLSADPWKAVDESLAIDPSGSLCRTNKSMDGNSGNAIPAFQQIRYGNGSVHRWAIHIPETIVGIQQGTKPVTEDGLPAPDGTADLAENLLKADDGFELDWEMDRSFTETGIPYFPHPYADLWKEALVGHLLTCVRDMGLTLPFLDYWPSNVKNMAMISHDSDLNVDESALLTLETLKEENVQSTWCMIPPGYSPSIYEKIKEDGHEIAFHYNALHKDDGVWSEEAFSEQLKAVEKMTSTEQILSNKNHYTLFEGWGELFSWCEKYGIEADQTRGPSKKGNVGFLFGTCHPYFPAAWADEKNRFYNTLEIGFLTQDLNHHSLADTSVIQPFLHGVKRVDGVAHFLFHQFHIYDQPKVREAIIQLIRMAKKQGFTFWTCSQINQWERDRRKLILKDGKGQVEIQGHLNHEGFTVLIPLLKNEKAGHEEEVTEKFGLLCRRVGVASPILNEDRRVGNG
ncbi:hypothetical protein [Rossellomorea sp. KS-H15a]|uniref:hypothetical protein n=1 Tax=Rossellomorea sp. KS-H15a TaxID=2963940 RepID=UPI0020C5B95D|nr:hypothetical protein [Rossellomorea sp. KS-H15a]UTE77431.1 hypothetical protein M1J35_01020 [Rossellomorea sp. KS-H15a]